MGSGTKADWNEFANTVTAILQEFNEKLKQSNDNMEDTIRSIIESKGEIMPPLKDGKGYSLDIHEIIREEIKNSIPPLLEPVLSGQRKIMHKQDEQEKFLIKASENRVALVVLGIVDLILLGLIVMSIVKLI